jgi:hypothetical protein
MTSIVLDTVKIMNTVSVVNYFYGTPIEQAIHRRRLFHSTLISSDFIPELLEIIRWNSALSVNFEFPYFSTGLPEKEVSKLLEVADPYNISKYVPVLYDTACTVVGFKPLNHLETEIMKSVGLENLLLFNNRLIDYQARFLKEVAASPVYIQQLLKHDRNFRFGQFKKARKSKEDIVDLFHNYISAVAPISQDELEMQVGCHFLSYPDLFGELLNFSKLKGHILND